MFTTKLSRLMVVCLFALALVAPGARAQRKKQIAVLNFDFATVDIGLARNAYGNQENLARAISDKLMNNLRAQGTSVVIERSQLEKVLHEQNLGTQGRIDPSTAAKVGSILGIDALIIGTVSVFDLQGAPKNDRDTYWDPKDLRARITVNFRVVNTTTAVVEAGEEVTGLSTQAADQNPAGNKIAKGAGKILGGIFDKRDRIGGITGSKRNDPTRATDEQVRNVVQLAVNDVVNQITAETEKYLTGERRQPEPVMAVEKQINGRVAKVNGPSLIITGINRASVRTTDRLYVRRNQVSRDPETKQEFRYSEKVGEVEVVEIQDQVIIGSFSGSGKAEVGDTVTNNPTGSASPSTPRETKPPSSPPADAPPPAKKPASAPATPARSKKKP